MKITHRIFVAVVTCLAVVMPAWSQERSGGVAFDATFPRSYNGTFVGNGAGLSNVSAGVFAAIFTNSAVQFVNVNGNDATAQLGRSDLPWRSIVTAATAGAALSPQILVGAGSNFITTSVHVPRGGAISGYGMASHIWGTNNLSLHGPMLVPTDNSQISGVYLHSDAPFGSYEDVSVGTVPTHATNWLFEDFTIWGRPSKYQNIDGVVFSSGLTNKGIIRNGTIAGGYDGFSFRDNELGDAGTYDIVIENVTVDIQVPSGNANPARGITIKRVNPSRFLLRNVTFILTNKNIAAQSVVLDVVSDTTAATVIEFDNVRFINPGGTNDISLGSAVTLKMSGGNAPDARIYNPGGATILYSPRQGASLTNIPSVAISDPTGAGAVVKSNSPSVRSLTLTPDTSATRTALNLTGNTLTTTSTTNYHGGAGALLIERSVTHEKSFIDLDEFDGGLITRWTGNQARKFEVVTPNFFIANGVMVTSGAGSPEGAVTAIVGSLYLRTDGGTSTTLYVKTSGSGNTGWTAK